MGNQAGIIIRNVKNELFHSAKRLILNEVKGIECLQSDIASLHHGVKFGQLADDFLVKVEDTSVVLAELLYILRWHETATDKIFHRALGNPLRVSNITFVSRQLFDEIRVDELQVKMGRKNAPNGNPVDARTLHGHFLHMMGEQQITHLMQLKC